MQYGGQNGGFGQQGDREKQRYVMMDARKSYTNTWATDLMSAPCTNPGFCLYAACWCVSILPRETSFGRGTCPPAPPIPPPAPDLPPDLPPTGFFQNTESARVVGLFLTPPFVASDPSVTHPDFAPPPIATATCA